jgi:integrase
MAYLERKPRKNGYVIRIKEFDHNASYQTKELNKTKARMVLTAVQGRINERKRNEVAEADDWTREQQLEWIKTGRITDKAETAKIKTLKPAIERYLANKEQAGKTFNTVNGYRTEAVKALEYFGDVPVNSIIQKKIQEWVYKQSKERIQSGKHVGDFTSHGTIGNRLERLKSVLLDMYPDELSRDPAPMFSRVTYPIVETVWDELYQGDDEWDTLAVRKERLEKIGLPADQKKAWEQVFFSEEEAAELVSLLEGKLADSNDWNDQRLFAAVLCSAYTGARRSELVRVKRSDIDLAAGTIKFKLLKGRGNKSWVPHKMPIIAQFQRFLTDYLQRLPESRQCVFMENDAHLKPDGILFDDKNTRTKANRLGQLITKALKGTRFQLVSGFHIHRHTLNSMLANAGNDTRMVMSIIGHKTERISLRYQHSDRNKQMAAKKKVLSQVF